MLKRFLALFIALLVFSFGAFAADANSATQAELDAIKGIGPALSGRIVEERTKAPFKDWNDLVVRVKGIGETSAAKLSTQGLTVNGTTFKGAAPAAKPTAPATATAPAAKTATATTPAPAAAPAPAAKAVTPAPASAPAATAKAPTAPASAASSTKSSRRAKSAASAASK